MNIPTKNNVSNILVSKARCLENIWKNVEVEEAVVGGYDVFIDGNVHC